MNFPHPNPEFPPPPRRGSLPWGIVAAVLGALAGVSLLVAAIMNRDGTMLGAGLAGALGFGIGGGIAFTRHARTGGWRSGRIIPAIISTDSNNAMQNALVTSWWDGQVRTIELAPGRLYQSLTEGTVVWLIQPTNFVPAQFIEIAAPEEFRMTPVSAEAEAWLADRLG